MRDGEPRAFPTNSLPDPTSWSFFPSVRSELETVAPLAEKLKGPTEAPACEADFSAEEMVCRSEAVWVSAALPGGGGLEACRGGSWERGTDR